MSNNCAPLSSYTANTLFLTADNVDEVIPDNFDLTPGTQVTVSCNPGYRLVGDETFSCTNGGEWSYSRKPYCTDQPEEPTVSDVLDQETKIMIGVVCAVAALIVLALIIMIVTIWVRDRRKRRERREFWEGIRDDPYGRRAYRGRGGPSTIDVEMYSRSPRGIPPPPYDGRRLDSERRSRLSNPIYLPDRNDGYRDYYDDIKKSRRRSRSFDDISEHEKKPYVRDWIKRSSRLSHDDDHIDRSGVYGRHSRDSHVWRNAMF